jgi:hypothetical protein
VSDAHEHDDLSPPPVDAFEAALTLIQLAAEPKAFAARLQELKLVTAAAEKARISLAVESKAHTAFVAKATAELEQREAAARAREAKALMAEIALGTDLKKAEEWRGKHLRRAIGPSGLSQEFPDEDTQARVTPCG